MAVFIHLLYFFFLLYLLFTGYIYTQGAFTNSPWQVRNLISFLIST
jgi:hypothetical protein